MKPGVYAVAPEGAWDVDRRRAFGGHLVAAGAVASLLADVAVHYAPTYSALVLLAIAATHALSAAGAALGCYVLRASIALPVARLVGWAAIGGWGSVAAIQLASAYAPSLVVTPLGAWPAVVLFGARLSGLALLVLLAPRRRRVVAIVLASVALFSAVFCVPPLSSVRPHSSLMNFIIAGVLGRPRFGAGVGILLLYLPTAALALLATWRPRPLAPGRVPPSLPYRGLAAPSTEAPRDAESPARGLTLHGWAHATRSALVLVAIPLLIASYPVGTDPSGKYMAITIALVLAVLASTLSVVGLARMSVPSPGLRLATRAAMLAAIAVGLLDLGLVSVGLHALRALGMRGGGHYFLGGYVDDRWDFKPPALWSPPGTLDEARSLALLGLVLGVLGALLLLAPLVSFARRAGTRELTLRAVRVVGELCLLGVVATVAILQELPAGILVAFPLCGILAAFDYALTLAAMARALHRQGDTALPGMIARSDA